MTVSNIQIHHAASDETIDLEWVVKRAKEISMGSLGSLPKVPEYALGSLYEVESGIFGELQSLPRTVYTLTVAEIWAAFPKLETLKLDDGYTPQEVAEAQRQFAADVRVAAKRNREDAAYERIQELQ